MAGGQPQADAVASLPDAAADLEQPQAEGVQLHPLDPPRPQPTPQRIEQPVGRRVQQQPELVGAEAMVTEAISKAGDFQILDGVLAIAAGNVPGVERLGRGGGW